MKKKIKYIFLLASLLSVLSGNIFSQEQEIISPYIQLSYFKNTDGQRILKTALTYSKNRMELPLPGMEISFYSGEGQNDLIGTVITDEKGTALLNLNSDASFKTDNDGMWAFNSEFKGNDTIEAGTSDITVKDVILEMALTLVDTIKTITVKAYTMDKGAEVPVSDETVAVFVPRMFSMLPLGELTLDESGSAYMEFPSDLPGDTTGYLTIIAKFDDNPTYGNVEKSETLQWGVPTYYSVPKSHRALWTKTPPKWMIYTLSILLAGVWGHYLFALISLIRIKRDANKHAKEEYRI